MSTQGSPVLRSSPNNVASTVLFIQHCVAFAAIAFHLYEWLYHLPFEIGHIWRKPSLPIIKWQYLFSRYAGTAIHITNVILSARTQSTRAASVKSCKSWHAFYLFGGESLMLSLQITLVHRLCALYNRHPPWMVFFALLVFVEYANSAIWGYLFIREMGVREGVCVASQKFLGISVVHISAQVIVWVLTLAKYRKIRVRILTLIIWDGSRAFGVIIIPFIGLLVAALGPNMKVNKTDVYQCIYPVFLTIFTSANCRMIKNMEHMHLRTETQAGEDGGSSIVFTSVVSEPDPERLLTL